MAGITNDKLLDTLNEMKADIAVIKELVPRIEYMYTDIYVGNGHPPMRKSCRDYEDEKKSKETAKTEAIKDKKDDLKWFKRSIIGVIVAQSIGIVFAFLK